MSRSYVRHCGTRTRVAHEVGHVPVPLTLKMEEKLERLVRNSCLERTGKEPVGVEVW